MQTLPAHLLPRRERERLARRRAMLDAARAVFAERGYIHATIEEIADRAEFGKGTLYNYFPGGKDELLRAVLDEVFDRLDALREPLLAAPPDPAAFREALRTYLRESARVFYRDRDLYHLAAREGWRLRFAAADGDRGYLDARIERAVAALAEAVERAAAAGALRPLPARPLARVLVTGVVNQVALQEVDGWPDDPDGAARRTAAFLTSLVLDGAAP